MKNAIKCEKNYLNNLSFKFQPLVIGDFFLQGFKQAGEILLNFTNGDTNGPQHLGQRLDKIFY